MDTCRRYDECSEGTRRLGGSDVSRMSFSDERGGRCQRWHEASPISGAQKELKEVTK